MTATALERLQAMSASPYPPEPPRRSRVVDAVMWLTRHRRRSLVTPHLHGGADREKVLYEYDTAETLWQPLAGRLEPSVMDAKDVLDIGCGWGGKLIRYAELARPASMTGFDLPGVFDPEVATAAAAERGLDVCTFTTGYAEQLPFPDGSFDIALMDDVLEHVADPERAVHEAGRVLRPGGLFIVRFPSLRMLEAHHLDRALTYPGLHYLLPLRTWAAGLNHYLVRGGGTTFEPFDEVIDTRWRRGVTRNLNGLDFGGFGEIVAGSPFDPLELELVGYELYSRTLPKRALFAIYRAARRLPWLREPLSLSVVFVGRRSDTAR